MLWEATESNLVSADMDTIEIDKTRDAFLDGRLTLFQPKSGPRTAIDAFFLAAAVPARAGKSERVLDAGTGTGAVGLAMCARVTNVRVTGVDIQQPLVDLANENARVNDLTNRFEALTLDITGPEASAGRAGLETGRFDHVVANPPFQDVRTSRTSSDPMTARAYTAQPGDMGQWVRFLVAMLAPGGTVTIIHRADAVGSLLSLLEGQFGSLTVYPLFPKDGAPAKRALVQGIKGSRARLRLLSGMVLHEPDGSYTKAADSVLRGMSPIDLGIRGT